MGEKCKISILFCEFRSTRPGKQRSPAVYRTDRCKNGDIQGKIALTGYFLQNFVDSLGQHGVFRLIISLIRVVDGFLKGNLKFYGKEAGTYSFKSELFSATARGTIIDNGL